MTPEHAPRAATEFLALDGFGCPSPLGWVHLVLLWSFAAVIVWLFANGRYRWAWAAVGISLAGYALIEGTIVWTACRAVGVFRMTLWQGIALFSAQDWGEWIFIIVPAVLAGTSLRWWLRRRAVRGSS